MKKLLLISTLLLILSTCFGQKLTKSPEFDFNFGSKGSLGFNFKNFNGWGFYLEAYGTGDNRTGQTDIDYSDIADKTTILSETILDDKGISVITVGLMINSEKIFNAGRRLNFIIGAGSMTEITYEETRYKYSFDYINPEYNTNTTEYKNESKFVCELGMNLNIIQAGSFVLGAETIYNTGLGMVFRGFAGLKFRKD